jgi:hypothetical protein
MDWPTLLLLSTITINFEHWSPQHYTTQMAFSDFKDIVTKGQILVEHPENLTISNSTLTFYMPKGKVFIEGSGAQIILPMIPKSSLTLEYLVYFDGGDTEYQWTSGGKLPGIAGGKAYTGGHPANQGDGFSARVMFGAGGAVFPYVYHVDMKGRYGDNLGIIALNRLKQREWNLVKLEITMNTQQNYDGRLELWANHQLVGKKENMRYCTKGCDIDKLMLVSFHGGQSPDYRPSKDQKIRFKWFRFYF